jgi:TetR/AcrR family transcriptional regulator, transcriptional repressor for nem operon
MPYTKEHKERSREQILQSAARLFPRLGYDEVSIDMLMQEAGLTRGGFYAHFGNKAEVYAEAIVYTASNSALAGDGQDEGWLSSAIDAYLCREHIDDRTYPCPLSFLVTDVNRRDSTVRSTYTRVYKSLNRRLDKVSMADNAETVMAATAMMIGGVAVARALDDRRTADKLLATCRETVKGLLNIV